MPAMKKLTVPCDFGGKTVSFPVYIGEPSPRRHPLHYQDLWIRTERGGAISPAAMDSFRQLQKLALEHNRSFEELCVEALNAATSGSSG